MAAPGAETNSPRAPRETRQARMEALARLPLFFGLEGRRVLVAGGGEPAAWGRMETGETVCRFERPGGEFVDVMSGESGALEIRLYGSGKELKKRVSIPRVEKPGLADELEIQGAGWPSYRLHLRLIEAERVGD